MAEIAAGDALTGSAFAEASLSDRFDLHKSRVLITGTQAIVRLLLMQKEADRRAGLNTAGFVTGYRGSPLGGVDAQMHKAKALFDANDILYMPGLNEDLAATAIWGAQQAEMRGEGKYDGVFSLWYGKGPGVDRSGDAFRHVNLAGTSRYGGALALMGDDHTAESSTTAHQSDYHFVDVMIPILSPAGVQEILDYGLYGFALSRYAGVWVGLKLLKDTVESTASIDSSPDRVRPIAPIDFIMPPGGLNIRAGDPVLAQEERLQESKRDAMLAFIRANRLNRFITSGGANPKIGVITVGKSYLDVRQAMDDLGLDEVKANDLGLRLYKIAAPWPIEPQGLREFARGLDLIIVVEEKRSLIEVQLREELYAAPHQPLCIGKKDERGDWLFPVKGALDANDIAIAIGRRLLKYHSLEDLEALGHLGAHGRQLAADVLDPDLVLEVHAEVGLRLGAILDRLAVLAHDDERALEGDQDREGEVVELVRVLVERLGDELVERGPHRREREEEQDERPAPVQLGDLVGEPLAPGEVLLDLLHHVAGGALRQEGVGLAEALGHLGEDGHRRGLGAAEVIAELLARQLEEHRVDRRLDAGASRLVVEERELAEVLAGADVLQHDPLGVRIAFGRRQEDLHRARQHDVHARALGALLEDELVRLERALGQPRRERLHVLARERVE